MKVKTTNRFLAVVLALFMVLTVVPFAPVQAEEAAETPAGTYVLNASDLPLVKDKDNGTFTDGQDPVPAGTDEYFKIHVDKSTRFDDSKKTFDDGFEGTRRINFNSGTKTDSFVNSIEFSAANPATVKVWWVSGDAQRYVALYNTTGNEVAKTEPAAEKNALHIDTFEISEAGKYFLGNQDKSNYIFKIEVAEHVPETYVLNASDLPLVKDKDNGTFTDGQDPVIAGTDDYFKIHVDKNTRFDDNTKIFDDGFEGTRRINFNSGTKTDSFVNSIEFTTADSATVKVWWVSGDIDRYVAIFDTTGNEVAKTEPATAKNEIHIDTFEISEAGKYFLGNQAKSNYIFKIEVTVGAGEIVRGEWADVVAPVITKAEQAGGNINVTVSAEVGTDGGDKVAVTMYDKDGTEVAVKQSLAEKSEHVLEFAPSASGTYTFKAVLSRDDEETVKESTESKCDYTLPLSKPIISSATNKGLGEDKKATIELIWDAVDEADGYNIYCNDKLAGTTADLSYTVKALTVGETYSFAIAAKRGEEEGEKSDPITTKATEEAQSTWGFLYYGPSTGSTKNGYEGNVNEDGKVRVFATGNGGKVVPGGQEGVSFYYTPIPTDKNFTFKATIDLTSWSYTNGQEGFGLLALDHIPSTGTGSFWTNQYMAGFTKVEYWWDSETQSVVEDASYGDKYTMRLGGGVFYKDGITPDMLPLDVSNTELLNKVAHKYAAPLETYAVDQGLKNGTYNIVGNEVSGNHKDTSIASLTKFILEIEKNNTGYFITYYDENGKEVKKQKFYDPNALSMIDTENVYVGFFAARNADFTASDITLELRDPKDDPPPEEKPKKPVKPIFNVQSASVANSVDYNLMVTANVAGAVTVTRDDGKTLLENYTIKADEDATATIKLKGGDNNLTVTFTPDPNQDLGADKELSSTDPIVKQLKVKFEYKYSDQDYIYVAPNGTSDGLGSKESPVDVYTAINAAQPGQTIVVMEGTYEISRDVRIERGLNGTAEKPIYMVADPEAKTRPVFTGASFRAAGNYWYFYGFDVTKAPSGGFYVNGNNNTLDLINAYENGNTGIQISAYKNSGDPRELWPQNNLVLNCTSHHNADSGFEDADGFAAKLTVGEGNVFNGCISYNNADDGWDLYAKNSSGAIGKVTIMNSVAFHNGYLNSVDDVNKGNGNGFKLGGENLAAGHELINSVSFENLADGITSNSCPDVKVINCTSFNNLGRNLNLYTNIGTITTDYKVENLISYNLLAARSLTDPDTVKCQNQDESVWKNETNYLWDGSKSANTQGVEITADNFVSLVFDGVKRFENGVVDLGDFLRPTEKTPENAGARPFDTESDVNTSQPSYQLPDELVESGNPGKGEPPVEPVEPEPPVTTPEETTPPFNDVVVSPIGGGGSGSTTTTPESIKTVAIVGYVKDASGNPIAGVTVELHSDVQTTVTDEQGRYEFATVDFGVHTIIIKDEARGIYAEKQFTINESENVSVGDAVITATNNSTVSLDMLVDGSSITFNGKVESTTATTQPQPEVSLDTNTTDSSVPVNTGNIETTPGNEGTNNADKNMNTGVVLFIAPVAVSAIAVLVSKKRRK